MGIVLESRRPSNQFLVDSVTNLDRGDLYRRWRWLPVESQAGRKGEASVVEDIAPIARSTFRAIADPHANRGLFVGGVTTPVGFPANAAPSVFGNSTKTAGTDSLSLWEVPNRGLVGMGNID